MLTASECERLRVVLIRTRNPLNIGAAARAISNFGFSHLRVVHPYEAAFREARSAVGASSVMTAAEEYSSVAEAVADCALVVGTTAVRQRDLHHPLKGLEAGASVIREALAPNESGRDRSSAPRRVAILFGSEKTGLSNAAFSHCHWLMRIPTSEQNISMNLGQAVAICLYEIIRDNTIASSQRGASTTGLASATGRAMPSPITGDVASALATAGDLERIVTLLGDVLRASGYPGAQSPPVSAGGGPQNYGRESALESASPTEEKLRRLVLRLNLSPRDAIAWLGVLRQIAWKLHSTDAPPPPLL